MITVLILASNPVATDPLRLDAESRAIDEALRKAGYRDQFDLKAHFAVRIEDLQELLLRHQPQIVHFSGHGAETSEIVLEDATGRPRLVPARALEALFELLGADVRCVVLNACYSEGQARAIARHVPCVIGMSARIGDDAASAFAAAFYQALAYGQSLQRAYKLGCVQLALFDLPDEDTPVFIARDGQAGAVVLVQPGGPAKAAAEPAADPGAAQFQTTVQGGSVGQVINIDDMQGPLTIGDRR